MFGMDASQESACLGPQRSAAYLCRLHKYPVTPVVLLTYFTCTPPRLPQGCCPYTLPIIDSPTPPSRDVVRIPRPYTHRPPTGMLLMYLTYIPHGAPQWCFYSYTSSHRPPWWCCLITSPVYPTDPPQGCCPFTSPIPHQYTPKTPARVLLIYLTP